jgi:hypothetical protein
MTVSPTADPREALDLVDSLLERTGGDGGAVPVADPLAARPGQEPPFSAAKRPTRPYKRATETRFTAENVEAT